MRLLLFLANSAGEIVSVDRLLTEVWGGVVVGSASVYEAVSQLRKLLGDVGPKPTYIATVPRKGYRLIAAVQRAAVAADTSQASVMPARPATPYRVWAVAAALVILALAAAYFLMDRGMFSRREITVTGAPFSDKSIAVLPFVDMSEKHDEEYFADGMAEEIIDLLVRIPGLKVIGRTSSFQYKGKTGDLRRIGTQLGVAYLL